MLVLLLRNGGYLGSGRYGTLSVEGYPAGHPLSHPFFADLFGLLLVRQVSIDMGNLRFKDPLPDAAQDDLNKAVACFAEAYGMRSVAMEQAVAIIDGDQRPSKIAEMRDTLTFAGEQHQACMQQYVAAATAHGFAKEIGWTDRD